MIWTTTTCSLLLHGFVVIMVGDVDSLMPKSFLAATCMLYLVYGCRSSNVNSNFDVSRGTISVLVMPQSLGMK